MPDVIKKLSLDPGVVRYKVSKVWSEYEIRYECCLIEISNCEQLLIWGSLTLPSNSQTPPFAGSPPRIPPARPRGRFSD